MTKEQASKHMDRAITLLGEHFSSVQIHATWMGEGSDTFCIHGGTGNFYARLGSAHEFLDRNAASDLAEIMHGNDEA